jgi:enoyl-CoA hydratase/carnithine racemase
MIHESPGCVVELAGRVAVLRYCDATLAEIAGAIDAIISNPFVEVLVARGSGIRDGVAPSESVRNGRGLLARLAEMPVVSLASLEGPCTDRDWEFALACDYRISVATPDAWLGFTGLPRWGSAARAVGLSGRFELGLATPREALDRGWIDAAPCERRAKIELRSWIDRLEERPRKRSFSWWNRWKSRRAEQRDLIRLSEFEHGNPSVVTRIVHARPIHAIKLKACPQAVPFAVEHVLAGGSVVTDDPEAMGERLKESLTRGRVTPLELEQARGRVQTDGNAKLRFESESHDPLAIVRATLRPHVRSIRVGFPINESSRMVELTEGTAMPLIRELFATTGYVSTIVPDAGRLVERERLAGVWDEAVKLVAEGYPIDLIDEAGRRLGYDPPLATIDRIGARRAMELVPRLRVFGEAGLDCVFYHSDRLNEPNTLAAAMLGFGPRPMLDEDDQHDPAQEESFRVIENRLRERSLPSKTRAIERQRSAA